jgi:hypothetical protein
MGELTLTHERIDDLPLPIGLGQTLGLDAAVDAHLRTHGLQQGLSNGQLTIVWLAYSCQSCRILSPEDHLNNYAKYQTNPFCTPPGLPADADSTTHPNPEPNPTGSGIVDTDPFTDII